MSTHQTAEKPVRLIYATIIPMTLLLWVALLLAGCNRSTVGQSAPTKPQIVTTTGMIYDTVKALVGSHADVHAIMGPGVDPHLYQPTRGDAVRILEADFVAYNGLHLEGHLGEVLERRKKLNRDAIAIGDLLPQDRLMDADGLPDPHVWMDVSLWTAAVKPFGDKLAEFLPDHADQIRANAEVFRSQLVDLDQWGADAIKSIPESQRILVTAHDAFRYFGKRYGIQVNAVQGISTVSEPSVQDINRLVDLVVKQKVPAIFFEESVSRRMVSAIVEGARRQKLDVSSDSTLFSDSMGAAGTPTGSYIGMMRHNFTEITQALGGSIPAQSDSTVEVESPAKDAANQQPLDKASAESTT